MNNFALYAYPDVMTTVCEPVSNIKDDSLISQLEGMVEFLASYNLPVITGPHLNISNAVIVLNKCLFPEVDTVLINPKIISSKGEQSTKMECYFFPGVQAIIKRPKELTLTYLNTQGEEQTLNAKDLLAPWLSYCIDCLNGKLILDHMSAVKKKFFLSKYKKQLQSGSHCGSGCGHDHH